MRMVRWGGPAVLAVCVCLLTARCELRAADEKSDPKVMDAAVRQMLFDLIDYGAFTYNSGDHAGCARIFERALKNVQPLLSYRPEEQKLIREGLEKAQKAPNVEERAFALRAVLDKVRDDLKPGGGTMLPNPKSLWDRLGGEENVKKIVTDFTATALEDPKVNFTRNGKYKMDGPATEKFEKAMVQWISTATGGPLPKYTGNMKEMFKDMGVTDAEFDAAGADLLKAMNKHGVKQADADEVMKIVNSARKEIVEEKKPDEKKPDDKKPDEKKPDDKKPEEKKPDQKEKKPDDK